MADTHTSPQNQVLSPREVEIRAYVEAYGGRAGDASLEYLRLVLDLLDEARAEIAQNAADYTACNGAQMEVIEALEAVMERAHKAWMDACRIPGGDEPSIEVIARALTEYGDQQTEAQRVQWLKVLAAMLAEREAYGDRRAREARAAQLDEGYCMVCAVYHRAGQCQASASPVVVPIDPPVAERLARAHTRAGGYSEAIEHAFRDGVLAGYVKARRG